MDQQDDVSDAVHEQFLTDAVLNYDGTDAPARRASARALLAQHPDLPSHSIWAAAAAADHTALQRFVVADPSSVQSAGGPRNWEPLLYLTYSRVHRPGPPDDVPRCLQLLLDAGANPNAGYLPAGVSTPFTALTGLFGGGEQSGSDDDENKDDQNKDDENKEDENRSDNHDHDAQPAHPLLQRLAPLLLLAGADPNDGQTLYNRMFGPSDDHLELLFEHGLGTGDGGPWHRANPGGTDTPEQMLRGQLAWAVTHGFTRRIVLLARHGVDLRAPLADGHLPMRTARTPLQLAVVAGRRQSADTLRELGVNDRLDPDTELIGALLDADEAAAAQLETDHPQLLVTVRRTHPSLVLRAAVVGRPDAIKTLVRRGFDVNALGRADIAIEQQWETALHHAAGAGKLDVIRVLLECGADRRIEDRRFGATARGWAEFFGQHGALALLA